MRFRLSSRNGRPTLRSTCTKLEKTSLSADAAEGPLKRYAATHKVFPLNLFPCGAVAGVFGTVFARSTAFVLLEEPVEGGNA